MPRAKTKKTSGMKLLGNLTLMGPKITRLLVPQMFLKNLPVVGMSNGSKSPVATGSTAYWLETLFKPTRELENSSLGRGFNNKKKYSRLSLKKQTP